MDPIDIVIAAMAVISTGAVANALVAVRNLVRRQPDRGIDSKTSPENTSTQPDETQHGRSALLVVKQGENTINIYDEGLARAWIAELAEAKGADSSVDMPAKKDSK